MVVQACDAPSMMSTVLMYRYKDMGTYMHGVKWREERHDPDPSPLMILTSMGLVDHSPRVWTDDYRAVDKDYSEDS